MHPTILIMLGFILGAVLGVAAILTSGFTGLPRDSWAFIGTLVGSSVTVGGAFLLATVQARSKRNEDAAAQKRKQLGARAVLSADLSNIIHYTEDCGAAVEHAIDFLSRTRLSPAIRPELAPEIILRLQSLIELVPANDADQLVDLMQIYQVQRARLIGVLNLVANPACATPGLVITRRNFDTTIWATVELLLRSEAMFGFARGFEDSISAPPFGRDQTFAAIRTIGLADRLDAEDQEYIVSMMAGLTNLGRWRVGRS